MCAIMWTSRGKCTAGRIRCYILVSFVTRKRVPKLHHVAAVQLLCTFFLLLYSDSIFFFHTDILHTVGISKSSLQDPCTDNHLHDIAGQISADSWKSLALELSLSNQTLDDHCRDYQGAKEQRFQGLKKWKQEKAHEATYYAFVLACVKKKNKELASYVCQLVKRPSSQ